MRGQDPGPRALVPLGPWGSGSGSERGGHTCPAPRARRRTNMAKGLDTAVAEGETERLEQSGRRAPRFWGQWGAAWKVRGCPRDIPRPSCGGRRWPLRDPARSGTARLGRARFPGGWERGGAAPSGRLRAPSVTPRTPRGPGTAARPGERGVGPRPEGATPRLAAPGRVPAASPRVKVKVSAPRGPQGAGPARTWERAPGTGGAMDGLSRRLRASLRLKRGRGG